ncbi:MAG: hypothetical protein D6772_05635 [Bacteroidetes bacterium]|nr:MAG: hypothetical protein D6772_05635 [Bacteroidota bacterium]
MPQIAYLRLLIVFLSFMPHFFALSVVVCVLLAGPLCGQNALATAEALAADGNYQASNTLLQDYIANHPARRYDLGRAWWLLSANYLRDQQLEKARYANAQSILLRRQFSPTDLAENYLREAEIELAAKNPARALQAAEQGLQMPVADAELYVLLHLAAARAHAAQQQFARVDTYLETTASILAIELPPCSPAAIEAYYTAAELELLRGNEAAARHWYVQALCYDRNLARLRELFARIYALPPNG